MDVIFFHTDKTTGEKRKLKYVSPNENTKVHFLQEYVEISGLDGMSYGKWIKSDDLDNLLKEYWDEFVFERKTLIEKTKKKECKIEPVK